MLLEDVPLFKTVIGLPVAALPFNAQIALILKWSQGLASKVVCIANASILMKAYGDPVFVSVLRNADLVKPDGIPLVRMLKLMGASQQKRVAGLDLLLALCKQVSTERISIFFLGSQTSILEKMLAKLEQDFPSLQIAGIEPLPFRPLSEDDDRAVIQKVNESGCGLVFVSLGCSQQEAWMFKHKHRVRAVMVGLGGTFPVYAGIHDRSPRMFRSMWLGCLYRLVQEPRRLWDCYRSTMPTFIWLAARQLLTVDRAGSTQKSSESCNDPALFHQNSVLCQFRLA